MRLQGKNWALTAVYGQCKDDINKNNEGLKTKF